MKKKETKHAFIYEVSHGGGYRIKTFLKLPTSRSVKFKEESDSVKGLRYYTTTENGLKALKKQYPTAAYGDKQRLNSKDLTKAKEDLFTPPTPAPKPEPKKDDSALSLSDKEYFKKHKTELLALLDDDVLLPVEEAISIHKTGKPSAEYAKKIKDWNEKHPAPKAEPKPTPKKEPIKADKAKVEKEVKAIAQDIKTYFYMTPEQVKTYARRINATRSLGSQIIDGSQTNKNMLPLTFEGLVRWAGNPGRYDMPGVDAPDKSKPNIKPRVKKNTKVEPGSASQTAWSKFWNG